MIDQRNACLTDVQTFHLLQSKMGSALYNESRSGLKKTTDATVRQYPVSDSEVSNPGANVCSEITYSAGDNVVQSLSCGPKRSWTHQAMQRQAPRSLIPCSHRITAHSTDQCHLCQLLSSSSLPRAMSTATDISTWKCNVCHNVIAPGKVCIPMDQALHCLPCATSNNISLSNVTFPCIICQDDHVVDGPKSNVCIPIHDHKVCFSSLLSRMKDLTRDEGAFPAKYGQI